MDLGLKEKVVIITGGCSGLGAAVAEAFAQEGAYPLITYNKNNSGSLQLSQNISNKYSVKSDNCYCDITDISSINIMLEKFVKNYGTPDILINNAGRWPRAFITEMNDSDWDETIRLNLSGHFYISRRFIKQLLNENKKGKIINIVSFAGFLGSTTGHAHYAAAKGGLIAFTKSLAREMAEYGITVNAVSPGMIKTPMTEQTLSENESTYIRRIPLGRISSPEEVAPAVVFLASNKADYITGATLDVSGGLLMH